MTTNYNNLSTAQDMHAACKLYIDAVYGDGISDALPHLVHVFVRNVCFGFCEQGAQEQLMAHGIFPKALLESQS